MRYLIKMRVRTPVYSDSKPGTIEFFEERFEEIERMAKHEIEASKKFRRYASRFPKKWIFELLEIKERK